MRELKQTYTKWYNDKYNRKGYLELIARLQQQWNRKFLRPRSILGSTGT